MPTRLCEQILLRGRIGVDGKDQLSPGGILSGLFLRAVRYRSITCRRVSDGPARAYAGLSQFDDAWRCIDEAMTAVETTKEKWCEAEVHRVAGEIELLSQERFGGFVAKYMGDGVLVYFEGVSGIASLSRLARPGAFKLVSGERLI